MIWRLLEAQCNDRIEAGRPSGRWRRVSAGMPAAISAGAAGNGMGAFNASCRLPGHFPPFGNLQGFGQKDTHVIPAKAGIQKSTTGFRVKPE